MASVSKISGRTAVETVGVDIGVQALTKAIRNANDGCIYALAHSSWQYCFPLIPYSCGFQFAFVIFNPLRCFVSEHMQ